MMQESLSPNGPDAWASLHGPFFTQKTYPHVPSFGGQMKKEDQVEDEEESFYDLENTEEDNFKNIQKRGNENIGKPLKISDLRFLKLLVKEVKIQNQEIQTDLNLQGDDFVLELSVPLPDPQKGAISTQLIRTSNFRKTALGVFEFKNLNSLNLKVFQDSFNDLVQSSITFSIKTKEKSICSGSLQYNKLFLAEDYHIDEFIPLYQSKSVEKEVKKEKGKGKTKTKSKKINEDLLIPVPVSKQVVGEIHILSWLTDSMTSQ